MNLSLKELNDLYYCVGKVMKNDFNFVSDSDLEVLSEKIVDEIYRVIKIEYNDEKILDEKIDEYIMSIGF